jgi:hypothetical protein
MDQESPVNAGNKFDRSLLRLVSGRESVRRAGERVFACGAIVRVKFLRGLIVLVVTATMLLLAVTVPLAVPEMSRSEDHPLDSGLSAGDGKDNTRLFEHKIPMHGRSLELHLAHSQPSHPTDLLVLYASGDGGWFGTAAKMFEGLIRFGYPSVGFSTRSYLKLLGYGEEPVSVDELRKDYQEIIRQAEVSLDLPQTTHTILTGWSRGAAFAVLVGSEKEFQHELAGVIAIGLPDKEELKIRIHGKKILVANISSKHEHLIFDTYQRIPLIAPFPFSLIQATGDDFLPASEARKLFGSDSETDKFFAVEAHNHRFSGGTATFTESLRESVRWIAHFISSSSQNH